jgi:hypothetical protein
VGVISTEQFSEVGVEVVVIVDSFLSGSTSEVPETASAPSKDEVIPDEDEDEDEAIVVSILVDGIVEVLLLLLLLPPPLIAKVLLRLSLLPSTEGMVLPLLTCRGRSHRILSHHAGNRSFLSGLLS